MNRKTNISAHWRLLDVLNLEQAAALIAGFDPNEIFISDSGAYFRGQDGQTDHTGAGAAKASFEALKEAINAGVLEAGIINKEPSFSYFETSTVPTIPNWQKTTIQVGHLKKWLQSKNTYPNFFFPKNDSEHSFSHIDMLDDTTNLIQRLIDAEQEVVQLKQDLLLSLAKIKELESLLGFDNGEDEAITANSERRVKQINFLIATAKALDYDLLAIPDGGKKAIWNVCEKLPLLFTESTFQYTWKVATGCQYLRMKNYEKFANRGE